MRIMAAILLSVALLAGTWAYTKFADSVRPEPVVIQAKLDRALWRIIVTRSFDCVPDSENTIASLSLKFKGKEIFSSAERINAALPLEITALPEVEQGLNEIFVAANLAKIDDYEFDTERSRALRVQIFRGSELIHDKTIWSDLGAISVEGSVLFEAPVAGSASDQLHDQNRARDDR